MSDGGPNWTIDEVAFPAADGLTLRGWLYLPAGTSAEPAPGVVMTHGFSAVKEMCLPPFAEALGDAGLAVLVYDHRNFGASDGEPRQEINPWAQARDCQAALTWLGERPEVDADRLGIWGSSFSGGEALVVAACDARVRAVVANVPFAGLPGTEYGDDVDERFEAVSDALLDTSGVGLADPGGEIMGPMPVVTVEGGEPGFLGEPESAEWFLEFGDREGSSWRNEVTLRNAFGTEPSFDPGVCVDKIAPTPLLMVVATEDRVAAADVALAAFDRADEPKYLVQIEGHHFAPYSGAGLEAAVTATVAFFGAALEADGPAAAASTSAPTTRPRANRSTTALGLAMIAVGEILEPEKVQAETVQVQPQPDDDGDEDLGVEFGDLPPIT